MTSSNGNIFRVTAHLCGEFTGHRWIPHTKGQWGGALIISLICAWMNGWVNNREASDLRSHRAHYDVIMMYQKLPTLLPERNEIIGNSPVTDKFPSQRPVTRSFGAFFDLHLYKRFSKQCRRGWFETSSRSLLRHWMNMSSALSADAVSLSLPSHQLQWY